MTDCIQKKVLIVAVSNRTVKGQLRPGNTSRCWWPTSAWRPTSLRMTRQRISNTCSEYYIIFLWQNKLEQLSKTSPHRWSASPLRGRKTSKSPSPLTELNTAACLLLFSFLTAVGQQVTVTSCAPAFNSVLMVVDFRESVILFPLLTRRWMCMCSGLQSIELRRCTAQRARVSDGRISNHHSEQSHSLPSTTGI